MEVSLFIKAWESFCDYYDKCMEDYERLRHLSNLIGPHFRMEADVVFHLARFCSKEFGEGWIHLDSPVKKLYFAQLDGKLRGRIDIDISEPTVFMTENAKRGIFVEVKYVWDGCSQYYWERPERKIISAEADMKRLQYFFDKGCCEHAIVVIVDEEPHNSGINQTKTSEWEKKYSPVKVFVKRYETHIKR